MNPLNYFQPLPQGTTTATLRRFYAIQEHIQPVESITVRVFAVESASALRTLLQAVVATSTIQVYVYPIEHPSVEVTLVQDGHESHIKQCNIDPSSDILQLEQIDETSRRQWRDVITAYLQTPYLIDVATPETNHLFVDWVTKATNDSTKAFLMDDLIDAVQSLLQAKTNHPFEETYVAQTTAIAGVLFVGSLYQWDESFLAQKINAAKRAFGPYLPVTIETTAAINAFVWENR